MKAKHIQILAAIILAGLMMAVTSILGALGQGTLIAMPERTASITEVAMDHEQNNCRYGATVPNRVNQGPWMPLLEAGWYNTFNMWGTYPPLPGQEDLPVNDAAFVPIIRVKQDIIDGVPQPTYRFVPPLEAIPYEIQTYSYNYPSGTRWMIGNETDVGEGQQDFAQPEVYARAYHEAYHFLKAIDPSYQIGIGSMAQATPGRLQYLDKVWASYRQIYSKRLPVDVWNLHIYILPEINPDGSEAIGKIAVGTDPALAIESYNPNNGPPETECLRDDVYCIAEHDDINVFIQQITAFRTWMREHGEQVKPLIVSEYSILHQYNVDDEGNCLGTVDEFGNCFTPERVKEFMEATFDYFETAVDPLLGYPYDKNKLVQQWAWHSVQTNGAGSVSNLLVNSYNSFDPGDPDALSEVGQFYREWILNQDQYVNLQSVGTIAHHVNPTRTLSVDFVNNGNIAITKTMTVTFYANEQLTQTIGSTIIEPQIEGCVQEIYRASIDWLEELPSGAHHYWVAVDASEMITESNELDNVIKGAVIVDGHNFYLPIMTSVIFPPGAFAHETESEFR